jgi:toxin YoeB
MNLTFSDRSWEQYLYRQETDKSTHCKINALIKECLRHPLEGTGKPDPLKGDLSGFWSRRIDREHRLVYRVTPQALEILSCRFHYG